MTDNDSAPRKRATTQTSPGSVIQDRAGWTLRVLAVVGSFLRVERKIRWFKGEQLLQETIERLVTPSDCWVICDPVVEAAREAEKAKRAEAKAKKKERYLQNKALRADENLMNAKMGGAGTKSDGRISSRKK